MFGPSLKLSKITFLKLIKRHRIKPKYNNCFLPNSIYLDDRENNFFLVHKTKIKSYICSVKILTISHPNSDF